MPVSNLSDKSKQRLLLLVMILLLTISVLRTNYGIWNADIPLGDDGIYIDRAFSLYEQNEFTSNLYLNIYKEFFKHISVDPIIAHYSVRLLTSLFSVLALFLLLSSLSFVSRFGSFVMALIWSLNLQNSPLIQFGNISQFVFATVCLAGYLWLTNSRHGRLLALVILLVAIVMRYEYALLLCLLIFQRTWLWLRRSNQAGFARRRLLHLSASAAILLVVIVVFVATLSPQSRLVRNFPDINSYFFLGFTQHYSLFTAMRDPTLGLDPYTEYDILINREFPGATDFFSAVAINPGEVASYLSRNLLSNILHIYYVLPGHSILLPSGLVTNGLTQGHAAGDFVAKKFVGYPVFWLEQVLTVLFIACGALWLLFRNFAHFRLRNLACNDDAVFVAAMAAVASLSFILHIHDPRYWVMIIPLLYWGPAALIAKCCRLTGYGATLGLSVLVSLVIVNPVFTSTLNGTRHTNKEVALALREKLSPTSEQSKIKVLGYYPKPLLTFAIPGRCEVTDNMAVRMESSYEEMVESGRYDLLIVDNALKKTYQYDKEKLFFGRMLNDPEVFGYQILLDAEQRDGPVRIFRRIRVL